MNADSVDHLFRSFPVLRTERLDLIEIEQHHLRDVFCLFSNPEVTRFYNIITLEQEGQAQMYLDHFRHRFKERAAIRWGMALKGDQRIIGTLGFNSFIKRHRANIGYDLLPQYWHKGLAAEALKAVLDFGFEKLHINRVEAEVMQGNSASERLLEKLGFLKEGVLRQWMLWNGRYYDMSMFSLLRSDHGALKQ